ncbi:MAG: hypothetical protein R2875_14295 [Desulfobacterales bacterium]
MEKSDSPYLLWQQDQIQRVAGEGRSACNGSRRPGGKERGQGRVASFEFTGIRSKFFAAAKVGAIVTQISPVYVSSEIKHQLLDSGAEHVICQDILYENLKEPDQA